MFKDKKYKIRPINEVFDLQLGKTPSRTESKYWCTKGHKWVSVSDMGRYDRFTSDTSEYISDEAVIDTGIKIVPKGTVIMSFKLTIGRASITNEDIYTNEAIVAFLSKETEYINNDYLRLYLSTYDWSYGQMNAVKGMTLNSTSIGKAILVIPPKHLQDTFSNFAELCDKLKFEAQ
ncbi:restriction endonuclease subunit S [Ligilactobacillus ruminis]|uniref:restriction endonuclease subunit S n=1 Tax=Ligilactobacillus ruminis TaxID=1623 RepID=UPI002659D61E|nr:restriction endonuclease subunit S [Ligilactobacillus ruminis]WKB71142.1 restriction endonuclease subunit S [Ligilactobacillus ruminis]